MAAVKLGWSDIEVVESSLTGSAATAYAIADNRTAELAEWDTTALAETLRALQSEEFDTAAAGYSDGEIDALVEGLGSELLGADKEIVEDEIPEPPVDPITKAGDLWILGEHRVLCGDSTKAADVARLLAGSTPFLMVTDPPYGVEYDASWRLDAGLNKQHQTLADGKVTNDDRASWKDAWDLFPGMVAYVWHGALHSTTVATDLVDSKFQIRSQIIWVKPSLVIGRGAYHWRHEPCWYAARGTAKWSGDRKQCTAWEIANMHRTQGSVDDGKTIHSTQKPVECMARPIRNHGDKDDDIYDPFLGSGTTLIAAQQLNRKCFGMEISPQYCDVIVKRWENLTGMVAVRESA
jgi:DNA modification methylase